MVFLDSGYDFRPRLAVVGGLVEIRLEVIELVARGGQVGGTLFRRVRLDAVDHGPFGKLGWSHFSPRFASVFRYVNKAVVRAAPEYAFFDWRLGSRENRAVILDRGVVLGDRTARRAQLRFVIAGQVRADRGPELAFVGCFEQHIAGRVQRVGIVRREKDREVPLEAILGGNSAVAERILGPDGYVADFARAVVDAGEIAEIVAAIDDFGVFWMDGDVAALAAGRGFPIPFGNRETVATASNAHGRVLLLGAVDAIRDRVVGYDTIELRRRLIHVRRPRGAAVDRNLGAAVVGNDHSLRLGRIDPQVMMVAVRRADLLITPAAVARTLKAD